jgi:hypothetical protein
VLKPKDTHNNGIDESFPSTPNPQKEEVCRMSQVEELVKESACYIIDEDIKPTSRFCSVGCYFNGGIPKSYFFFDRSKYHQLLQREW